ncbi:MAG: ribonuclease P protein component [Thiohalomonadaceae bacterium]
MTPDPANARFARLHRITRPADFRRVFATGCRSAAGPLVLISMPNGLAQGRLGLAISKRYVRRAVDRNRFKRLAREMFRTHVAEARGRDVVLLVRGSLEDWDNARFRAALITLWRQHLRKCAASSSL